MKFPGRRHTKHYFPVTDKGRVSLSEPRDSRTDVYIVGIDQLLVDIEIEVSDDFLQKHNFHKGESFIIDDQTCEEIYQFCKSEGFVRGEFPGGAIGNTLHNYAVLSEGPCYALGSINKQIEVGDYAFKYLSKTSGLVDMSYLMPAERPMGRAFCFITPDMERTFAISKGCMNEFGPEYLPAEIIAKSAALLISAYSLRSDDEPICKATVKACEIARSNKVPVVMSMGTSKLVEEKIEEFKEFIDQYVTCVAMNKDEALALTGHEDPLLACEHLLETVDMALVTVGSKGLYLAAYTENELKRNTNDPLVSKAIVNYNEFEYSRGMLKDECSDPIKIYTHISPFYGGPNVIKNTNGAGDAALSALLHDITANNHHKYIMPTSPKHNAKYLSYSSISQISKYANRVSFEVLSQNSPRLFKALPEKEDSLEEGYWSK